MSGTEPPPASAPVTRAKRIRRRVARAVVCVAGIILAVVAFRLGFVDINDHPGMVRVLWVCVVVFILAFPFVGFSDASPGRRDDRPERGQ